MARIGMYITLVVDKWEMGWGAMSLGWAGWSKEHTHDICTSFLLLPFLKKVTNVHCERGCEGKFIPEKLVLNG